MISRITTRLIWIAALGVTVRVASAVEVQTSGRVGTDQDQNAAAYYSRAFDAMLYPTSPEQKEAIQMVINNGWSSDNQNLAGVVDQHKTFFETFQKGLSLKQCDFSFGKDPLHKTLPKVVKTRDATYLMLLRSRYLEHVGDIKNAMEGSLSLLTFAQHIGQTRQFVAMMLVEAIEQQAIKPLKEYVSLPNADSVLCGRIAEVLKWYEGARPSISQFQEIATEEKVQQSTEAPALPFDEEPYRKGEQKYATSSEQLKQLRILASSKTQLGR